MESHIIELFVTVVCAVLGSNGLWAYLQSRSKTKQANNKMLLGLAHNAIFDTCARYIERGGITRNEMEDLLKYLYQPYSELGGNGTAEVVVNKAKLLPIISEEEAELRDKTLRERKGV